jgi:hypothetical protein
MARTMITATRLMFCKGVKAQQDLHGLPDRSYEFYKYQMDWKTRALRSPRPTRHVDARGVAGTLRQPVAVLLSGSVSSRRRSGMDNDKQLSTLNIENRHGNSPGESDKVERLSPPGFQGMVNTVSAPFQSRRWRQTAGSS